MKPTTTYGFLSAPDRYNVTFVVLSTGEIVTRTHDSEYKARLFVNRLKHSKRCKLISCPIFK